MSRKAIMKEKKERHKGKRIIFFESFSHKTMTSCFTFFITNFSAFLCGCLTTGGIAYSHAIHVDLVYGTFEIQTGRILSRRFLYRGFSRRESRESRSLAEKAGETCAAADRIEPPR